MPRAQVSRSALAATAVAAITAGGTIADLRRDAWGHGLLTVARAVLSAGAEAVLVDDAGRAELADLGVPFRVDGGADIDAGLLYGLSSGETASPPPLRLVGRVMSTKPLRAGDAVSYGYTYRAPTDRTVALVTGGYAQGIPRALGNSACVEIDGALRPIVGRVAMDVCVVDLGSADAAVGSEVVYFGGPGPAGPALASWSAATGLTAAELLVVAARLAHREETP